MEFIGSKFYPKNSTMVRDESVWWADEYKEVTEFGMTRSYAKYLREKRDREEREYLMTLKSKLEYQMKTYGYVDEIDLQEYMAIGKTCYGQ